MLSGKHYFRQLEHKDTLPTRKMQSSSCCCCCEVASVVSDSVRPHRQQPTRLLRPGILQARTLSGLPFPSPMHDSEK